MLKTTQKYIISFPKERAQEVSEFLVNQGVIEVIDQGTGEEVQAKLQDVDYKLASVEFALSLLKPFVKQKSFIERTRQPKILMNRTSFQGLAKQVSLLSEKIEEIEDLEKRMETLKQEKRQAQEELKELKKFANVDFIPEDTKQCFCVVVEISARHKGQLTEFCLKKGLYQRVLFYSPTGETFLIIGLKNFKNEFVQFLEKTLEGHILQYNFKQTPVEERQTILQAIKHKEDQLQQCRQQLRAQARLFERFQVYYDFLSHKKSELQIKKGALRGGFLDYVLFWALPQDKERLQKAIRSEFSASQNIYITQVGLEKNEEQPVVLENKGVMAPFQYVTEIFGAPKATEIDPTPYLSIFFILFFGLCLTDAGYGILLFLFTGLALLFLRNLFKDTKLIRLLFYGGISTFVVGILFGGFFGISQTTLNKIPVLSNFKMIDPLKDTVLFMGLTFGLGYLQIVFAEVVKIISAVRNKQKKNIFSGASWIGFYVCLGLFLLSMKLTGLKQLAIFATLTSGLFLVVVEGWGQKIFLVPLVGLIQVVQGLIGGMSDVLSYSRLMALGLGTAVIALIVNQIAMLFGGMIPYVGWLVAGLILIGGHIFNLGINALSGFIHSGRLQYVEFFPKFLEGGGRRFEPVKPEYKYIKVEK